jgi:hypothetical protein
MKRLFVTLALLSLVGCGFVMDDAEWVKSRAESYYKERGFSVVGYQGYNIWGTGRCYWYTLRQRETTYESCLLKWGDELHEYGLKAIDALRGGGR